MVTGLQTRPSPYDAIIDKIELIKKLVAWTIFDAFEELGKYKRAILATFVHVRTTPLLSLL